MYRVLWALLARLQKCFALRISTWPKTYVQVQKSASLSRRLMERIRYIYVSGASDKFKWICLSQTIRLFLDMFVCLPFSLSRVKPEESDTVTADFYGPVFHESYRWPTVANASDNALSDGCQDTVCGYIGHIYAVKLLFRARECDISMSLWWILFEPIQPYIYKLYK